MSIRGGSKIFLRRGCTPQGMALPFLHNTIVVLKHAGQCRHLLKFITLPLIEMWH